MQTAIVVQYKTSQETGDENERLIGEVFAELATSDPGMIRYATIRLEDGVSFLHFAVVENEDANPLMKSPAFAAFQADLGSRCIEGPSFTAMKLIGSYGVFPS